MLSNPCALFQKKAARSIKNFLKQVSIPTEKDFSRETPTPNLAARMLPSHITEDVMAASSILTNVAALQATRQLGITSAGMKKDPSSV